MQYCLPIRCETKQEVLRVIEENSHLYQFFEVWLGTITDIDDGFLKLITSLHGDRLIVLFRKKDLEIPFSIEQQRFYLKEISGSDALLDLDIRAQRDLLEFVRDEKLALKLIASFHDYKETPAEKELFKTLGEMEKYLPSVVKVSTYCNSPSDAVRLLALGLTLKEEGKEYIILGMGPHGAATRIFGTLWGNKLVFAPREEAHASAPGQLTRGTLETVLGLLKA